MKRQSTLSLVAVLGAVAATVTSMGVATSGIAAGDRLAAARPNGAITVSAASSLTEVFDRLGNDFERKYRGPP